MSKGQVVLKSDIPRLLQATPQRVRAVVSKAAFDVQAVAAVNTPVDTGALKNSLFAEMDSRGDTPRPAEATVGYTVEYAPHVELGHHTRGGRYIPGRYMLTGAVNKVEPAFRAAVKQIVGG